MNQSELEVFKQEMARVNVDILGISELKWTGMGEFLMVLNGSKPLDGSKEESKKVSLKLNIQKTKIMASGSITSWEIDGQTVETVSDFILGGPKITIDGGCSREIKRHLLLGRKVMTNLDNILKSRDITLPTRSIWSRFFQWSCMDVRVGL